jgi:uncharacterized protein YndB with AHSA1/START domain
VVEDDPIVKEIFIEATAEDIYPYLTDARKYVLWMGLSAELDPRPGGAFKVDPNGSDVITGEYLEIVPNRRIVFTWGWQQPGHPVPAGSTRVEIDLIPKDAGTLVRLVHHKLPAGSRERHVAGWTHYLGRLAVVLSGKDPGPDPFGTTATRHG